MNKKDVTLANMVLGHIAADVQKEVESLEQQEALRRLWNESDELEGLLARYPSIVMVEGEIGLGKSNTARILSKFGGIGKVLEPVEKNPLLDLYYEDMKTFGPILQVHLINDRLMTLAIEKQKHPNVSLVFDRSAYGDPWVFCEALCSEGLMDKMVKVTCQKYFHSRKKELEGRYETSLTPDLIVLLTQEDTKLGWERACGRGRSMEMKEDAGKGRGLTMEFYETLHGEYKKFPERLAQNYGGLVLALPQDVVVVSDSNNSKGILYVVKTVKEAIKVLNGF